VVEDRLTIGRALSALLVLVGLGIPMPAAAEDARVRFADLETSAAVRQVAVGGGLRIEAVPLAGDGAAVLELTRFRVFAPGARVVVHSDSGQQVVAPEPRAFFRGAVAGAAESFVFLAVGGSGVRGLVTAGAGRGAARRFEILPGPAATPAVREVATSASSDACAADRLPELSGLRRTLPEPPAALARPAAAGVAESYAVAVAVETDWELFQSLGSAAAVSDFAADLIGAASAIYQRDVSTTLQINYLSLWQTPADPWTVTSGFFDAIYELGDYWHANHLDVERTVVHMMSGKPGLGGGIGFGGVLCSPDIFFDGHWIGGYSLSGALNLSGMFRDTYIASHELGHNFDSRHSHCYNDMPDPGDPPIDMCYSGDSVGGHVCYQGPTSLPPDGGSIMSYCHLLPGGYANMNLWLGLQGSFGVDSQRVPERMLAHLQAVAACLPPVAAIFADGFESGDTSAW
jgi:Metallo-peptidase family M12